MYAWASGGRVELRVILEEMEKVGRLENMGPFLFLFPLVVSCEG